MNHMERIMQLADDYRAAEDAEDTELFRFALEVAIERAISESAMDVPEEADKPSALDKQEGGQHYKNLKMQPVEFIHANGLGFCEGSVVKYVCRHQAKNGAQDIKKAIHYLELILELHYGEKQ
jgi:hypothetical protein